MDHDFTPFLAFWRLHESDFTEALYTDVVTSLPHYAQLPRENLIASIHRKNALWQQLFLDGDTTPIANRTRELVQQRTAGKFPLAEMIKTGDLYRDHLWRQLNRFYTDTPLTQAWNEQIEEWTRVDRNVILTIYSDELDHIRAELSDRVELLEKQTELIRDLATPLIPIATNVVALPLIGKIDSQRVEQLLETLLEGIAIHQAQMVIIDITGVPVVDTFVAQGLVRAAKASRLLGTRVLLTGIRPEVAQTIVQLGADLGDIVTRSTLREGIAYALGR